jgi:hypothetical protein
MEGWSYDFEEYPYKIRPDPIYLPDEKIIWNRDDLDDKENLEKFVKALLERRSVGLRIYGVPGSGKTWLIRYFQKELLSKDKNAVIFYVRIVGAKSTFSEFYSNFMASTTKQLEELLSAVVKKIGRDINKWISYWGDPNLAKALHHIYSKDEHEMLARDWLADVPYSPAVLKAAGIFTRLATDMQKVDVLEKLLHKASELFSTCVLVLDDIALVKRGFGRELGRIIKDIWDGFYERFGLICTYTAEASGELIDAGYDLHFYRRFEYEVGLRPVKRDYVPTFLRLHHTCYRKKDAKIEDQLYPFTEDAIYKIIDLISPTSVLPGDILRTCGNIVLAAEKAKVKIIDKRFVDENQNLIPPEIRAQT